MQPDMTPIYTGNSTAIQTTINYAKTQLVERIERSRLMTQYLEGEIAKIDAASAKNPQPFRGMLKSIGLGFLMNIIAPSYESQKSALLSKLRESKATQASLSYMKGRQGEFFFIDSLLDSVDHNGSSLLSKGVKTEIEGLQDRWRQRFGKECEDFAKKCKEDPNHESIVHPASSAQIRKSDGSPASAVSHPKHDASLCAHADGDMDRRQNMSEPQAFKKT